VKSVPKVLFGWLKSHFLLLTVLVLGVSGGVYYTTRPAPPPTYETGVVEKGDIVQEVSVTGRVESENEVELSFDRSGRVVRVPKGVGDQAMRGDVLVSLDVSELAAQIAQVKANIDYEIAKQDELKKGARAEDIAVGEAQVKSAQTALDDTKHSLADKLAVAYTQSDDAIHNKVDHFFSNPRSTNPEVNFPTTNNKLAIALPPARIALESSFGKWALLVGTLGTTNDIAIASKTTSTYLSEVKSYLEILAEAVNGVQVSSMVSEATLDSWKLDVSTARTNVSTALSSIIAADTAFRAAQSALRVAEEQLSLKRAGATAETLAQQAARIAAQRATLATYEAQAAKMSLVAPFSGVLTRQDAKVGQAVSPGVNLVSLMSDGAFKIEANIPEVDIAKIKVGDSARISLDAYGADIPFPATVATIDPAETVLEGVPTYKVTLRFNENDPRVRSGMTANIDIETAKKVDVLRIPSRAVFTKEGEKFVRIPAGATTTEVTIVIGLRGSNGMLEVLSGLSEGERIVTFLGK
jgi:RND family efflux transporter MFP subunit